MKDRSVRKLICMTLCIIMLMPYTFLSVQADSYTYTDDAGATVTIYIGEPGMGAFGWSRSWSSGWQDGGTSGGSSVPSIGSIENLYQYAKASNIQELIDICQKYDDREVVTGVRNQIIWMNQLYSAAVQGFVGHLGLGETLLLSVLNHSGINEALMKSSYSTGDLNREIAKKIAAGAKGYVDVDTIAKETGLKAKDIRSILERIAAGSITEKTIAVGKNRSRASSRGVYVNHQALKQDKVWKYLVDEVDQMTKNPDSLTLLYNDLGTGYVDNMLSGQDLDKYQVSLYKDHLAKTLDTILEKKSPISISTITKNDPYKVKEKAYSALSKLYKYEMDIANNSLEESLPEELSNFLKGRQANGFTESDAKEYLILSEQYKQGDYGIEEAAKLLSRNYKYVKEFESVMDTAGDVFSAVEEIQKVQEFLDYMMYDHSEHIELLDTLVNTLSDSGADMELLAAARDLKQDYETKYTAKLENVYDAIIDDGISAAKSAFPPLGIAEACISYAGSITGASDTASALETGFAMQGICKQALEDYENAVMAVNNGDTSEKAVSEVLTTFEMARQSLASYYEAMVTLAETKEEKAMYSAELKKIEKAEFGYAKVSVPVGGSGAFGGGGGGGR